MYAPEVAPPPEEAPGPALVPRLLRPPPRILAALVGSTAVWGMVVDSGILPLLRPSGNSTILQATTAAPDALLGILFGPLIGALPGILRDGSLYLALFLLHPVILAHPHLLHAHPQILHMRPHSLRYWGHAAVDVGEDVMLGVVPGLAAQRTRRLVPITIASGAAAWLSLPALLVGTTLVRLHPGQVVSVLTTVTGDWDEPVDPGLLVYALLTAALTALTLARWTSNPRRGMLVGVALALVALVFISLGAHA